MNAVHSFVIRSEKRCLWLGVGGGVGIVSRRVREELLDVFRFGGVAARALGALRLVLAVVVVYQRILVQRVVVQDARVAADLDDGCTERLQLCKAGTAGPALFHLRPIHIRTTQGRLGAVVLHNLTHQQLVLLVDTSEALPLLGCKVLTVVGQDGLYHGQLVDAGPELSRVQLGADQFVRWHRLRFLIVIKKCNTTLQHKSFQTNEVQVRRLYMWCLPIPSLAPSFVFKVPQS